MPFLQKKLTAAILSFGILVPPVLPSGGLRADGTPTSGGTPSGPAGQRVAGDLPASSSFDSYPSEMEPAIQRFESDLRSVERTNPTGIAPSRRARLKQFYLEWLEWVEKREFSGMGLEGKTDFVLFRNHLQYELRHLDVEEKQYAEMEPLIPFAKIVLGLDEARRRMEPVDSRHAAELVAQVKKQVEETRKAVALGLKPEGEPGKAREEKGPAKPAEPAAKVEPIRAQKYVANRAANALTALRKTFKDWFAFYNGYDPVFTWWMAEPYKQADKALEDYRVFLREQVLGIKSDDKETIVGDPIGRDALLLELSHEMIPYTPEELIALARKELAWCDAEMIKASRELGYGDDWHGALEHVKGMIV